MTVIMNMWYKSTITLLTVLLCVDAVQNHCRVVQPPQAHVTSVGSSVTLGCRFQLPANMTQFRIKWLYSSDSHAKCGSDLEVFQSGIVYPGDENKTEEDPEGRVRMVMGNSLCKLTLTSMERHYRGMYFCQVTVEIPELQQCCGNGTWVDIGVHEDWWIWLAVGLVALTVAMFILGFFIFRRKRREEANPIYVNVGSRPGHSPGTVTPRPRAQPRSHRRAAEPKSLEALSVPKSPSNTNSLKTQGRVPK